jgi:hypothetical protein
MAGWTRTGTAQGPASWITLFNANHKEATVQDSNRRGFLRSSAAAIAASRLSANDRIRVAVIGLRGRGRELINSFYELAKDNVEIVALCDADQTVLSQRTAEYEKLSGKKVQTFDDMRKVFDDKTIDAVGFATPNHWHALGTIWACQAGKDVYVEKPGSHNIFEGRKLVEAARKYNRMVQHGTQNRSSPNSAESTPKLPRQVWIGTAGKGLRPPSPAPGCVTAPGTCCGTTATATLATRACMS